MRALGDPVEPVLLEEKVEGFLAQGLTRALEVHGQHPQLFPRLRLQVDRQNALALATRRPPGGGVRLRLRLAMLLSRMLAPCPVIRLSRNLTLYLGEHL